MDFSRPLSKRESTTNASNLRLVGKRRRQEDVELQTEANDEVAAPAKGDELDQLLVASSDEAARNLLLACRADQDDRFVDCSLYPDRLTERKESIQYGDLVVLMESFDNLNFAYVKKGEIFNNRNGHFYHDDFVGKPFGTKQRSRNNQGFGYLFLLRPTPELWARSLNHRTQIVHELDQSQIIFQLGVRPNLTVVESGTGSGAMSHAFLRSLAPAGHLHTYEFNESRVDAARQEFENNGLSHLATVYHRDVCAEGNEGGFDLATSSVDAVFLDLPKPWLAVPHAASVLFPGGRLASYSPCVEQTQRTVAALTENGFHTIKTMEYRLQEHYVDEIRYQNLPTEARPKYVTHNQEAHLSTGHSKANGSNGGNNKTRQEDSEPPAGVMRVARPFPSMRGHTAFLTFATAGSSVEVPN